MLFLSKQRVYYFIILLLYPLSLHALHPTLMLSPDYLLHTLTNEQLLNIFLTKVTKTKHSHHSVEAMITWKKRLLLSPEDLRSNYRLKPDLLQEIDLLSIQYHAYLCATRLESNDPSAYWSARQKLDDLLNPGQYPDYNPGDQKIFKRMQRLKQQSRELKPLITTLIEEPAWQGERVFLIKEPAESPFNGFVVSAQKGYYQSESILMNTSISDKSKNPVLKITLHTHRPVKLKEPLKVVVKETLKEHFEKPNKNIKIILLVTSSSQLIPEQYILTYYNFILDWIPNHVDFIQSCPDQWEIAISQLPNTKKLCEKTLQYTPYTQSLGNACLTIYQTKIPVCNGVTAIQEIDPPREWLHLQYIQQWACSKILENRQYHETVPEQVAPILIKKLEKQDEREEGSIANTDVLTSMIQRLQISRKKGERDLEEWRAKQKQKEGALHKRRKDSNDTRMQWFTTH
ncbi:hypothetical protein [Endozoicomonas sp. Mp262]|uniref:hypothetical protein n=1 Tax=Endozoicomonas sp. Mp262 TaxID=2919499 RepID=UPI0021D954EA